MAPLITLYDNDLGTRRLLTQPRYVAPVGDIRVARGLDEASTMHQTLFGEYLSDLKDAYDIATSWWAGIIVSEEERHGSREKALEEAFNARVAGAASNPHVVWVVRRYWLKCVTVNVKAGEAEGVAAETFLLQWLIDAGETNPAKLIACMPYWPIGLDENGAWC
ncbi:MULTISPECIES: hypothetical protein [unclassified Mesorhizobium]|uniref:hypothetical protein n=1 Tax=unclassified Mesorhizobium TaxID=325217 RepID=UPI001125F13C|nr:MULTISPECIES: hypothetical protein [unclassified Mesorhizobium]TPJ43886.1 hypothetical protein FJ437_19590 [Mesorhizobium sp. B2-6-6]MCA0002215.1 hypothetical protein [Mesorhizobium sp. B264B2A]MCA0008916.1 hypothetical protein [Mesorhizobium sp. B264B1B]MCA0017087.1 hypothetical protein [Mesorhizobium sp. B264B1A]TPJ54654.1 hypothetical protein FJ462_33005 [Mesorhizobium sp. B2-6-7]